MDYGRREFLGLAAAGISGFASAKVGLRLPKADVFVAGAGPAGFIAAIAAARNGAKVTLAESFGFPGGMATAGLVGPISKFNFGGKRVVGGLAWEFVERMAAQGGAITDLPKGNVPFAICRLPAELNILNHYLILEHFHHPKDTPYLSAVTLQFQCIGNH